MTPIYTETAAYAQSVGELDLYRISLRENKDCKNAIDNAIYENFDGFRLKKDCYKPVVEQFGEERVLYVLANTLQLRGWDGRFSHDNKAWVNISPFRVIRRRAASIAFYFNVTAILPFWMASSA